MHTSGGLSSGRKENEKDKSCKQYGWVEDSAMERAWPICGGDKRVIPLYRSRGNVVKIWTMPPSTGLTEQDHRKFIIKYTGIR